MVSYEFTVPGSPKPWQRAGGRAHRYTPASTRKYQQDVALIARGSGVREIDGPVALEVDLYWPDNRRRDLDNGAKTIADALNGIAYDDDSQIVRLVVRKFLDRKNPRAEVFVSSVNRGSE